MKKIMFNDRYTYKQIDDCERSIAKISNYGFRCKYFIYTILTDDLLDCRDRAWYWYTNNQLHKRGSYTNEVIIHAQPYRDPRCQNNTPQWQKDFARWANKRELYNTKSNNDD